MSIRFIGVTIILLLFIALFLRELGNEAFSKDGPHYGGPVPEVRGVGPATLELKAWLLGNTTNDARILFETSLGRVHDQAHIAGYLAISTNRQFVGGPYVYMHHAGFWDGYVFGRDISNFDQNELCDYLSVYNIGWVIVHSVASKEFLHLSKCAAQVKDIDGFLIYRTNIDHSYILSGTGTVDSVDYSQIHVTNAGGDSLVLKYHYSPGMSLSTSGILRPYYTKYDPVPFIEILKPENSFHIYYR